MILRTPHFFHSVLFFIYAVFFICLPFSKAIVEICSIGIFAVLVLSKLYEVRRSPSPQQSHFAWPASFKTGLEIWILAFFMTCLASMVNSAIFYGTPLLLMFRGVFKIIQWFVLFYGAFETFRFERYSRRMAYVVASGSVIMVLDSYYQWIFGYDLFRHFQTESPFLMPRLRASFGSDNAFAAYLIMVLPCLVSVAYYHLSRQRSQKGQIAGALFFALGMIVVFTCLTQTRSRGGWVGLLGGLFFVSLFFRDKKIFWFQFLAWSALLLLPLILNNISETKMMPISVPESVTRDEEIFRYTGQGGLKDRWILWERALGVIRDYPVFGSGINTYNRVIPRYKKIGQEGGHPYAHNSYLQVAAELGLVGLFFFLMILYSLLRCILTSLPLLPRGSLAEAFQIGIVIGVCGILIKAAVDTEFHSLQRVNLFWLFAGLALAMTKPRQEEAIRSHVGEEKLKVIHIANHLSLQNLIRGQLVRQRNSGLDVAAITSHQAPYDELEGIPVRKITIEEQNFHFLGDFAALFRLFRSIRKEAPDVVHTHSVKFGILGRLAARAAGAPYVIHTVHGIYDPFRGGPFGRWVVYALEKISSLFCDLLVFVSPSDEKIYINNHLIPKSKSLLIGNGIDLNRFDPSRFSSGEIRQKRVELGIAEDEIVIGIVGRLVKDKGYAEFFEMAGKLARRVPNCRFLVVASRYRRGDSVSEDLASRAGVGEQTIFLYERSDMPELYRVMDILIHASWREGFPRALMEAAAMGVPRIATDIEGNRNAIQNLKTGYLTPARDSKALLSRCLWLINHKESEEVAEVVRRARKTAKTCYDEEVTLQKIAAAYGKLLGFTILENEREPIFAAIDQ